MLNDLLFTTLLHVQTLIYGKCRSFTGGLMVSEVHVSLTVLITVKNQATACLATVKF